MIKGRSGPEIDARMGSQPADGDDVDRAGARIVDGNISGEGTISGSTNTQEGVRFELQGGVGRRRHLDLR